MLAHAPPRLHLQPLRKLHLKEEADSGGRLLTASASSPSPAPSSAPHEAGRAAAWLEPAGRGPGLFSAPSRPETPHELVSPSVTGCRVLTGVTLTNV